MSSNELEDIITGWCMSHIIQATAFYTNIKVSSVEKTTSPSLRIAYDDVARYIAAAGSTPVNGLTKEIIKKKLLSRIGYAPISLVEKLAGDRQENPDQECIMAIVKLLTTGHLPTPAQCPSIFGIFVTDGGCDLTNNLLGSSQMKQNSSG
ncbi:hypothetical protein N7450_011417 [Penicillium hetheringtonii]|uniref:Uncharacterized protein n=1 Tax=Penicillium hetheringtonii TaxID=911720 RepID=A0AAD6D9X3_9EURO|nr:hypothetical protein N7450_011417 [Penicillium hetheringtonii]